MRDFPGANGSPRSFVVAFFPPPATCTGVLEPLQKWVGYVLSITSSLASCNPGALPIFFNGSNTPALTGGRRRTPLRIMGGEPFVPGKSRIGFHSHTECMEEDHEYANELGKQGGKNPRKIPKFSINHERFSRIVEKNI